MKQEYDVIDDETKISVVAGVALREGDEVIPGTFNPVALTQTDRLGFGKCVTGVRINHQPPSAYKLIAEFIRTIADVLEKEAEGAK